MPITGRIQFAGNNVGHEIACHVRLAPGDKAVQESLV